MSSRAQQHTANEVGGGNSGRTLDDLEAAGFLDKAVTIISVAIGRDVVAVHNVLAAVVGDVVQLGDVRSVANRLSDPATGVRG